MQISPSVRSSRVSAAAFLAGVDSVVESRRRDDQGFSPRHPPRVESGSDNSLPPLSSAQIPTTEVLPLAVEPTATYAGGGTWAHVHLPRPGGRCGGGIRSEITHFSASSQRRLLRVVNSIDRTCVAAERVLFVTLTYPKLFPEPRAAKDQLELLILRFRRESPGCCVIWKLEPQAREAPHFHLLVFMTSQFSVEVEQAWWANNWAEIVASEDPNHRKWHLGQLGNEPCVQQIRSWNGVARYAGKYLCKTVDGAGWDKPGRWWGVAGRKQLPVRLIVRVLSRRAAHILRRACVRHYEHQPSGVFRLQMPEFQGRCRVQRMRMSAMQVSELPSFVTVRPIHRRWKSSRGGCSLFIPSAVFERLLSWAIRSSDVGRVGREQSAAFVVEAEQLAEGASSGHHRRRAHDHPSVFL